MLPETRSKLERERIKRVAKAERGSGYQEGARIYTDGTACFASVTFYPTVQWWLEINGKRYPLDDELWAQTSPMKI